MWERNIKFRIPTGNPVCEDRISLSDKETPSIEFKLVDLEFLAHNKYEESILYNLSIYECTRCGNCGCETFIFKHGVPMRVIQHLKNHVEVCGGV